MKIKRIPAGMLGTNCYLLMDETTGETAVIDPGGDADILISAIKEAGAKVKYILLTHGHFDHTGAVMALKNKYAVPVYISRKDYDMIKTDTSGLYVLQDDDGKIDFSDSGSVFYLGELKVTTIETPGHTPGGLCFYAENVLMCGDTLFEGSVGRTDFPGADHRTLINSIKSKLMKLPDDTVVLPGHGGSTTIGNERNSNPYL